MPQEVKDVSLNVPLQRDAQNQGISTLATTAFPGASTQDSVYSTIITDAWNQIYTSVDKNGFWEGMAFNQFSGYGYTLYSGNQTPGEGKITATVTGKSNGIVPSISINGSNWSLFSTTKQLATNSNGKGKTFAYAGYSNVKVQNITGINTVFKNVSYVSLPSGLSDTWEEDTYVWF